MKRFLSLALVAMSMATFCPYVYAGHWSDTYYTYVTEKNVLNADISQVSQTNRDQPITREAFYSLIISALYGKQEPSTELLGFSDISQVSPEYSGYLKKATEKGILSGVAQGDKLYIQPQKPITRQEAAVILGRGLQLSETVAPEFSDANDIAPWASDWVAGCEKTALFAGYADGSFRPKTTITWAESIKLVAYAMENGYVTPIQIVPVAGNGAKGSYDGNARLASFHGPRGILVVGETIYIADTQNNLIRKIQNEMTSVVAGKIMGYDSYDAVLNGLYNKEPKESLFARPSGLLQTKEGILVLDTGNHCIRLISDNKVSIFAGTGKAGSQNGAKTSAQFSTPQGFCMDDKDNLYIADTGNNAIRMIAPKGVVSTVAAVPTPSGVAYYDDQLFITSSEKNKLYTVKDGTVTVFAGADTGIIDDHGNLIGDYRDGVVSKAYFNNPTGICVAEDGTLYIADTGNGLIRKIKSETVSTIGGHDKTAGTFVSPRGLYLDENWLYVTDSFKNTVTKIGVGGI